MVLPDTTAEYLRSLEKKRDEEIPLTLKKIEEEMEKLKKLHLETLREQKQVQLDIESLLKQKQADDKSLLDLPYPIWRIIEQCAIAGQHCGILNACLSSPNLDDIISRNSSFRRVRLTGEKAFGVLFLNDYLDKADITSCLNSGSEHLQRFAGSNWLNCWVASMEDNLVELNTSASIRKLLDEIKMKENCGWKYFTFKRFKFDSSKGDSTLRTEYDDFWDSTITFLRHHAQYMLTVEVVDQFADGRMQELFPCLVQRFPRIVRFKASINSQPGIYYGITSFRKSREPYHISHCSGGIEDEAKFNFLTRAGIKFNSWSIHKSTLKSFAAPTFDTDALRNMKTAQITYNAYIDLETQDVSMFHNLENVTIDRPESRYVQSFAVGEKLPRLKTLRLLHKRSNQPYEMDRHPPSVPFQNLKKLIMEFADGVTPFPIPIDQLPRLYPSLMYLKLQQLRGPKTLLIDDLQTWMNDHADFTDDSGATDILRLYVEGRSLDESIIWSLMKNLLSITVETVHRYTELVDDPNSVLFSQRAVAAFNEEVFYRPKERN